MDNYSQGKTDILLFQNFKCDYKKCPKKMDKLNYQFQLEKIL